MLAWRGPARSNCIRRHAGRSSPGGMPMIWPATDRLPLVIGVTGHRDLRPGDLDGLGEVVGRVIDQIKRSYLGAKGNPARCETPIIVLSDLEEGADQLMAKVALDNDAQLIAVLPLPVDAYRREFEQSSDPNALAQFDELRARTLATVTVPPAAAKSLETMRGDDERRAQRQAARILVARHSHVLIALWDGVKASDGKDVVGSTAKIIALRQHGVSLSDAPSARASLDSPESGAFVHVMTPRLGPGGPTQIEIQPWGQALIDKHHGNPFRRKWRGRAAKLR